MLGAMQSFTAILAGYETTANALAFTIYCLAAHPDKQDKLAQEVAAFGERCPQYDDLQDSFMYVDAALKEAMRLYPPVTFAIREAESDMDLAGVCVCMHPGADVVKRTL